MSDLILSVPEKFRRSALRMDETKSIESAVYLIDLMCHRFNIEDMANIRLLDMGCGTKLTQAFLQHALPIKQYVGIDIYKEMIEFLQSSVRDARFSFYHMNTHNAMYNPAGEALAETATLPLNAESVDVISLFSVFTHLAPHDYRTMLKVLRPYIKPDGKLIFSLFINELTDGGFGLIDGIKHALGAGSQYEAAVHNPPDFLDADKTHPLKWAVYSKKHALELIESTGWAVESLNQPEKHIQHHFICRPV